MSKTSFLNRKTKILNERKALAFLKTKEETMCIIGGLTSYQNKSWIQKHIKRLLCKILKEKFIRIINKKRIVLVKIHHKNQLLYSNHKCSVYYYGNNCTNQPTAHYKYHKSGDFSIKNRFYQ